MVQHLPLPIERDATDLQARHVRQIGGQAIHAQRDFFDRFGQFLARLSGQGATAGERAGQADDRRQWRADVMSNRAQ